MTIMSSQEFAEGRVKDTSAINKSIMNSGIKELLNVSQIRVFYFFQAYKPAWFYFHSCFGQIYGQILPRKNFTFERNYIENEVEGKVCIDIAHRKTGGETSKEKVIIALHGVTGSSKDSYLTELTDFVVEKGYNMVIFNHFAPEGEKDLKLMDMNENRHMDEVIRFVKSKFDKGDEECEIYIVGFSLGGNHTLRYIGTSSLLNQKNQKA